MRGNTFRTPAIPALPGLALLVGCAQPVSETLTLDEPVSRVQLEGQNLTLDVRSGEQLEVLREGSAHGLSNSLDEGVLTLSERCLVSWQCEVTATLTLPPGTGLTLSVGRLDAWVQDVEGGFKVDGDGGVLHGTGLSGGLEVAMDEGDVDLALSDAPDTVVDLGAGDIRLAVPAGSYAMEVDSARGTVRIEGVEDDGGDPLSAWSGGGDVSVIGVGTAP